MPQFRYEAIDTSGVPIHGVSDAPDQAALQQEVAERGLKLISSSEVSLEHLVAANKETLPRLFQLRLGEQLREALLTGLPAHDAVRAIAAEPISHPIPGIVPWLWGASLFVFLLAACCGWMLGSFGLIFQLSGLFTFAVMPLIAAVIYWLYQSRPKAILRRLSDKLESGESLPSSLSLMMPAEIRSVLNSNVDDSSKARVAADMIPNLLGGNLRIQQFVMALVGPLLLLAVVVMGIHSIMLFVIPSFKKIFEDFGTDLPGMTLAVVKISDALAYFGVIGWLLNSVVILAGLVGLSLLLASHRGAEMLEKIPVFGIAFRWAMQARVARVLSAMIRNGCSYSESIRVATSGSGFVSVSQHGEILADELDSASPTCIPPRKLSGLPISMLFVQNPEQDGEERRGAVADTFQNLSEMLEMATVGQGKLLALFVQFFIVMFTGLIIGCTVLALFLPLIKLLNDLS